MDRAAFLSKSPCWSLCVCVDATLLLKFSIVQGSGCIHHLFPITGEAASGRVSRYHQAAERSSHRLDSLAQSMVHSWENVRLSRRKAASLAIEPTACLLSDHSATVVPGQV